jgi:peptidoglycan/LPS O-acetylase OafA/YrhL
MLWQLQPYGAAAVGVFFVLSGYVICYATATKETSLRDYTIARLARLYSVMIPVMVMTVILDTIGLRANPEPYRELLQRFAPNDPWQAFTTLTFTNMIWFDRTVLGTMGAMWSLSFEVWYYVLFSILLFCPRRYRTVSIVGLALFVGPKIVLLAPLWLSGVAVYRLSQRRRTAVTNWLLTLMPLVVYALFQVYSWKYGRILSVMPLALGKEEFAEYYITGLCFAVHLLGVSQCSQHLSTLHYVARPIRWLSGATFVLYLGHLPLIYCLTALSPWTPGSWQNRLMLVSVPLIAIFLLAEISERRKHWWRKLFVACFDACRLPRLSYHP